MGIIISTVRKLTVQKTGVSFEININIAIGKITNTDVGKSSFAFLWPRNAKMAVMARKTNTLTVVTEVNS